MAGICTQCNGVVRSRSIDKRVRYKGKETIMGLFINVCDSCGAESQSDTQQRINQRMIAEFKERVNHGETEDVSPQYGESGC